jgi:hypothetical protein
VPEFLIDMDAPLVDAVNLEINDVYTEEHHLVSPVLRISAGKTGMQPHIRPTEISVVLSGQFRINSLSSGLKCLQNKIKGDQLPGSIGHR